MRKNCSQVIVENFFEPCVLYLLLQKPSYGYEIQRELKDKCICDVNVGNLYRFLSRMQKQECIERKMEKSSLGPKRYIYTVTKRGEEYLSNWINSLKKQNKIISLLIKNYQKNI